METQTEFQRELDSRLAKTWEILFKIWRSKAFNIFMDIMRILTVALLIIIIITLYKEIEIVKILGQDVCKICAEKTGCNCFCNIIP